jgi:chemotaxis protein histidine kinase CheA/ActR/RegA family two-component response regulator
MAIDMKKFLARFVEEAREHVIKLENGIVSLEKNPADQETVNAVFRSAHTIKGSSRMMKLTPITEVAHKLEDVLGAVRDNKIKFSKPLSDVMFNAIDAISDMIEKVASGQEINTDNSALCEKLAITAQCDQGGNMQKDSPLSKLPLENGAVRGVEKESQKPAEIKTKTVSETMRISSDKLDELIRLMGEMVSSQNRAKHRLFDINALESQAKKNIAMMDRIKDKSGETLPDEMEKSAHSLLTAIHNLRLSVQNDNNVLALLTSEFQSKALRMRMVPLSLVFDSIPRMARDISASIGKKVDIIIEGEDIELDKKILDKIGDPLMHIIRNAIDHGIETVDERIKLGKPEAGAIRLSASYDAGNVLIEVKDDGNGISLHKIKDKALRKKMFNADEIEAMSESEIIDLIFQPGFSTSAIVTDVSGRGVGMDVVKKNIVEDMKGTVIVDTATGEGTSFYIRLPLTLAVLPLLLISVSGMIFAIPARYVREIIRAGEAEFMDVVDKRAIRLRNEFIPVESLNAVLMLPEINITLRKDKIGFAAGSLIIIVNAGNENLGLIVDELIDEDDMVIKPLPKHMKNISMVAGLTVSGRDEIINVLHIPAVINAVKNISGGTKHKEKKRQDKVINILVVDDSINTREIEKSILESYGYKVELAEDGVDGMAKAEKFKYDAVITDVEMPGLDGFSLTERLRGNEFYKDVPIIIVTSREKEEDKRKGIKAGADAYIVKGSFDQTNLIETLQNLIGLPQV